MRRELAARDNVGTTHVNAALSTFMAVYTNGDYVADRMCPPIRADKWSDTFFKDDLIDIITAPEDLNSPSGAPAEYLYGTSTDTYTALDRELLGWVPWRQIQNSDEPLRPRENMASRLMNGLMLAAEIRVADSMDTAANYATANQISATAVWSNETTGNPLLDLQAARAALASGGFEDSIVRCCMALDLWHEAQRHPKLTSLLSANERGPVRREAFEDFFDMELVITEAQKNTATKDASDTVTKARIWDTDKVRIVRVPRGEPNRESMMFSGRFRMMLPGTNGEQVQVLEGAPVLTRGAGEGSIPLKVYRPESNLKVIQNDMGAIITGC